MSTDDDSTTSYTDGRVSSLTDFERHATIPIIICAVTSAVAVTTLLTYLAISEFNWWRRAKRSRQRYDPFRHTTKFKNQGYFWLINLFVADLIQSIGWALSAYPLSQDQLWPGLACDVQGFFINWGDVSSSIWSLVIAIHTCLLLAGGQRARAWASEKSTSGKGRWILTLSIWLGVFFLSVIGPILIQRLYPEKGPFYNGAGAGWCWIGKNYPYERIFFHYLFIFIDMGALTCIYLFVFIYIRLQLKRFTSAMSSTRGNSSRNVELDRWQADLETAPPLPSPTFLYANSQIMTTKVVSVVVEDRPSIPVPNPSGHSSSLRPTTSRNEGYQSARKRMLQVARSLLWYPLIYLCLTAPITIGRLASYGGADWGSTCIFIGASIYACAGWCNVLLYTATRKGIVQWTWCGWSKKKTKRRPSPVNPHYPGYSAGTDRKVSQPARLVTRDLKSSKSSTSLASTIPPSPLSRTNSPRPSNVKKGWEIDGVDFTHATGFDTVDHDREDKQVHDKYCIQSRLDEGSQTSATIVCTCKLPPNISSEDL